MYRMLLLTVKLRDSFSITGQIENNKILLPHYAGLVDMCAFIYCI